MRQFVITGASTYGVNNKGDDAMLAALVQGLQRDEPGCEITFLCRHPDKDYDRLFGINSLKNLDHNRKKESRGRFFLGLNSGDDNVHLLAISEAIKRADMLIVGGNSFMEVSDNSFLHGVSSYTATLVTLARFLGTQTALFGLNVVDDISDNATKQHARFVMENVNVATMRENSGRRFLQDIGISTNHVHVLGDPAYAMRQFGSNIRPEEILAREGIKLDDLPLLGISFRHEYWHGDDESYSKVNYIIAQLLDKVIKELRVNLLFIPNCTYTQAHKWQDDRLTHREIVRKMSMKDHAYCIEQDLSVAETYALFPLLQMHLSNRRHSCIFAAMNNVPFLSIASVFKGHMAPFLDELGVPGQMAFWDNVDELIDKIFSTWQRTGELRQLLRPNVERLMSRSLKHVPVILESLL